MQTVLYQSYSISDLTSSIKRDIDRLSRADPNSTAAIKTRQEALANLTDYQYKDARGNPMPPPFNDDVENRLVEIEITSNEGTQLGVASRRISVHALMKLASAEITPSDPDTLQRSSYAAYILSQGRPHKHDKLDDYLATGNARYLSARQAFAALSTPGGAINANDQKLIEAGNAIIDRLDVCKYSTSGRVFLTSDERQSLKDGQYNKFELEQIRISTQDMRQSVNRCVDHMYKKENGGGIETGIRFKPIHDPKRLAAIEDLMRCDTTASWLLECVAHERLPVILCEYLIPKEELANRSGNFASYAVDYRYLTRGTITTVTKDIDYIKLFGNTSGDDNMAVSYTHEARHFWQAVTFPIKMRLDASPIDNIIYDMLCEADARAIHTKTAWGIHKNTGHSTLYSIQQRQIFARNVTHGSLENVSLSTKVRRATQAAFINWLQKDFTDQTYLAKFINLYQKKDGALQIWSRTISDNQFLTDDFLKRLSQVGNTAFYLDAEGTKAIRKIFMDNLPAAIAQAKPFASAAAFRHG